MNGGIQRLEEWREILDFPGYYVSSHGNVRGKRGNILKQECSNGYLRVNLFKEGKELNRTVHRLVALAFLPNPNNLPVVNHLDENKSNNNIENLEWCTYKHNRIYSTERQQNLDSINISASKIRLILAKNGKKLTSVIRDAGISLYTVKNCMKRGRGKAETIGRLADALGVDVTEIME